MTGGSHRESTGGDLRGRSDFMSVCSFNSGVNGGLP